MDYRETLDYLYNRFPMFQNKGQGAYKPGLETSLELARMFGNPQIGLGKVIHIAGTNGKGSTAHTLAAILQSQGYKTALYTSPHLVDFRERIRIDGRMMAKDAVVYFTERFRGMDCAMSPSFFELTTMMAFEWFAKENVDFSVIETGLGGRLDTTNIVEPFLSIITNISFDHTGLLGDTLGKIAFEKAGIIKEGVPVIVGNDSGVGEVFVEQAVSKGSEILFAKESGLIMDSRRVANGWEFETKEFGRIEGELGGECQKENAATVLAAVMNIKGRGVEINTDAVRNGFKNVTRLTGLMGRWMRVSDEPLAIADTGHNVGGWEWLAPQIDKSADGKKILVLGFVNDKDVGGVLELVRGIKNREVIFTSASVERAMPAGKLASIAQEYGIEGDVEENVTEAYKKALARAGKGDMVFVGGSTFVVADLLTYGNCFNFNEYLLGEFAHGDS